jgi:uncharacterized cupredoxin-like copper-binding protein
MRRTARMTGAALAAAAALGGVAACGDDDGNSETRHAAPAMRVVAGEYAFAMPKRIKGGVVSMDFLNNGKEPHVFDLVRLDPGRTLGDIEKVLEAGREPPSWAHAIGGVPPMTPGARLSITRKLRPGRYTFVCLLPAPDGRPHWQLGMKKQFTVVGESGRPLPRADGVIVARDDRYELPKVGAGRQTLELRNAASRRREFELMTFKPGKGPGDLQKWFERGYEGELPATLLGAIQTVAPGTSVFLTADFERGVTYVLSDRTHGAADKHLRARFTVR